MKLVEGLTSDPKQTIFLAIEGYDKAILSLEYKPNQYGWFYSLSWGTFTVDNIRVARDQNILRQFKNLIPFGIAIITVNGVDPVLPDEFLSNTSVYILTSDEVKIIEAAYYGA
jgi:hypothetical protein